jgi:hypothetical protein
MPLSIRPHRKLMALAALFSPVALLMVGCPHRSPVWSPDSKHLLLLARSSEEPVDRPAGGIWLVDVEARKAERLPDPAPSAQYLAAAWIDERSFVALTALPGDGEIKEGSEAIWRGGLGEKGWTRVPGPEPSGERTPRRVPLVIQSGGAKALVYASGSESVVAVDLASGKEIQKLSPAELVGPGPAEGFLITRPEPETGGLELAAYGPDLKQLWARRFSALTGEIAAKLGKKPEGIVINDTSSSVRAGTPPGTEVSLTMIYTDVSWREGVSGYYVTLSGKDGSFRSVAAATALPGRPGQAGGAAWAITPAAERGSDTAVIRSFPLGGAGEEARVELKGTKKAAVYGYSLSPSGKEFAAVIAGAKVKILLFPIEGSKINGRPAEIEIGA